MKYNNDCRTKTLFYQSSIVSKTHSITELYAIKRIATTLFDLLYRSITRSFNIILYSTVLLGLMRLLARRDLSAKKRRLKTRSTVAELGSISSSSIRLYQKQCYTTKTMLWVSSCISMTTVSQSGDKVELFIIHENRITRLY